MTRAEASSMPVDARALRQVLSTFVTGVTVVTTVDRDGRRHGITANSFNSVSLDPPLVLWSQALSAFSHPAFRDAGRFAINILARDQVAVSDRFARAGSDKFAGIEVREGLDGLPLIQGCAGYLECSAYAAHAAGDHMVFIGRVQSFESTGRPPLAFGGGRYLVAEPHDFGRLSKEAAQGNRSRLRAVRLATHAAIELAARIDQTIGVAVWGNHGPTVLHWEPSTRPVSMNLRLGAVLPVLGSASGRVLAAWQAEPLSAPFILAESAGAGHCGTAASGAADLDAVRRDGVAVVESVSSFLDRSEVPVVSASVPVLDADGEVLVALTVLGERGGLDLAPGSPVLSALKQAAAEVSQRIRADSQLALAA